MKNEKYLIIVLLIFVSCLKNKTKEEIIEENLTIMLKEVSQNPNTFEFVSMEINKTVSVKERRQITTLEKLNEIRELNKTQNLERLLIQVETEYDFLENQSNENNIAVLYVDFVVKSENRFKVLIPNQYIGIILNNNDNTVLNIIRRN